MVKCGVFVTTAKAEGLIESATTTLLRITEPFVNIMSRRNAPGPSFEVIPRDRPLRRADVRANHGSIEAQQLGPRLRKLYSPPVAEHPDDIRMLIIAIDGKLQKQ
jgi:hypothetical protein